MHFENIYFLYRRKRRRSGVECLLFFLPFVSVKEDAIEDMLGSLSGVIEEICKRYAISVLLLR